MLGLASQFIRLGPDVNCLWCSDYTRSQIGVTRPGSLFHTLPTALLTFHAIISSAANSLSRSTGRCAGSTCSAGTA